MTRIFDFHVRLAPGQAALDRLYAVLDEHGLARAAVAAGGSIDPEVLSRQLIDGTHVDTDPDNDAVLRACDASDGRLLPIYFANPHRPADVYRERAAEFRGLEISPAVHGVRLDAPRVEELVRIAAGAGHSVYVVCLIRAGAGIADLVLLAKRFPQVTFVVGHGGVSSIDFHGIASIEPHANICLETSGGYSSVLAVALRRLGAQRVLFGTEHPLQHPAVELAKFQAVGVADDVWERVAWRNAMTLMGEEPDDD